MEHPTVVRNDGSIACKAPKFQLQKGVIISRLFCVVVVVVTLEIPCPVGRPPIGAMQPAARFKSAMQPQKLRIIGEVARLRGAMQPVVSPPSS